MRLKAARPSLSPEHVLLVVATAWCAAFPLIGLSARLHLYADGSIFSYAVAAGDAWEFHWRQISGRVAAYAFATLPGQEWGRFSGDPSSGVVLYAALYFLAPAFGLAVTWFADRTGIIRLWAAMSTALLCPVMFGFPTELWLTHAAIWPALALAWSPRGHALWVAATLALTIVVLSHEAGIIWAAVLLSVLAFSPARASALLRAALSFGLVMLAWTIFKIQIRPDPYDAEVLGRNALNLFSLSSLLSPLVLTVGSALLLFGAALLSRRGPGIAFGVAAGALIVWWTSFDTTLHASDRYYLRTLVMAVVPGLLLLAALHVGGRVENLTSRVAAPFLVRALLLVTLVHVVETVKFTTAWRGYVAEVRTLAAGADNDPALGDPEFVSSARISARFKRLSWHSTTPFLSVMVSEGYAPRRLVVDPDTNYFWFDCAAATANAAAQSAMPSATRDMVRRYACLHR